MTKISRTILMTVAAIFLVGTVFVLGVYVGAVNRPAVEAAVGLTNKEIGKPADVDFEVFWQAWNLIDERYVDGNSTTTNATGTAPKHVSADNQQRVYGAISGMVAALGDPYTVFFPPKEKKMFEEEIRGNFGGVGMEVGMRDDSLTVISPLKDSPAIKAGIRAGDKIIKIGDKISTGMTVEEGIGLIRGEKGTPVTITLSREGLKDPIVVTIIRDTIVIPTLDTETIVRTVNGKDHKIFVIHLYNFGEDSANAFRRALRELVGAKTDKLILDLRGNPGGYLEAAVDMASFFLPQGKIIVQEYSGNKENDEVFRSKGYDVFSDKLKMVVLVDKGSASASEILAGALSEHGKATLVGEQTFGKGSVQELVPLMGDTSIKITVARWLTPNGVHISQGGLTPGVVVAVDPKDYEDIKLKKKPDPQIEKAIELLIK